jgi:outer membrane protein OmpA-like peptidoglycan-associated protein
LTNASVAILDAKGNTIETKQTDSEGKVSYDIECQTGYAFYVKAANFETETFQIQKIKSGQVIIQAHLVPSEVVITDTEVILKNVFFDFDRSNITAQGANELDKLVKVMKEIHLWLSL